MGRPARSEWGEWDREAEVLQRGLSGENGTERLRSSSEV